MESAEDIITYYGVVNWRWSVDRNEEKTWKEVDCRGEMFKRYVGWRWKMIWRDVDWRWEYRSMVLIQVAHRRLCLRVNRHVIKNHFS